MFIKYLKYLCKFLFFKSYIYTNTIIKSINLPRCMGINIKVVIRAHKIKSQSPKKIFLLL